ncbi:MAG: AraC family ligand binding domain-containing protein, partial [Caulobacter sp.]
MPILSDMQKPSDWLEPDDVPRPIVVFGAMMDEVGAIELDSHRHRKGQIILVQRGALSCEVEGGLWVVPPRSAIWIPGGALHAVKASGSLEGYNAFIDPRVGAGLPTTCCAV